MSLPSPTPPAYETPPGRATFWGRTFTWLRFYTGVAEDVLVAWRHSRRGRLDDAEWIQRSRFIIEVLERCGGAFDLRGLDVPANLPGPAVFIGNHMSTMETFLLPCLIAPHRRVTFVVKESLIRYPFFKDTLLTREPVVVGRKNPRDDLRAILEDGCERISRGISVIVFPQTTRTSRIEPSSFNSIGVKLAKRAGVPVVPVAIKSDAWGTGRLIRDIGPISPDKTVHVEFASPMEITGNGREQHEAVISFIQERLETWSG